TGDARCAGTLSCGTERERLENPRRHEDEYPGDRLLAARGSSYEGLVAQRISDRSTRGAGAKPSKVGDGLTLSRVNAEDRRSLAGSESYETTDLRKQFMKADVGLDVYETKVSTTMGSSAFGSPTPRSHEFARVRPAGDHKWRRARGTA